MTVRNWRSLLLWGINNDIIVFVHLSDMLFLFTKKSFQLLLIISVAFALLAPFPASAQQVSLTQEKQKEILESELAKLEAEIAEQEAYLAQQKAQTGSITRDLNIINAEIDKKKLEIQKKQSAISQIANDIANKNSTISQLGQELNREKASLARLLRRTYELDSYSVAEMALGDETVSEFFTDSDNFGTIQASLHDSFSLIVSLREKTAEEKALLEQKKNEEANKKYEIEQQKKTVEQKEQEQKVLLSASKNKEKTYEQVIAEREKQAAAIRTTLFELRNLQNSQQGISFGEALSYAEVAAKATGVRPAFILAILQQESALGKNVGTCNRVGDTRTWRDIMPGPNDNSWRDDQASFLQITSALGISPDGQPLSCPLASGGWGGAMGPSQFIPTTWLSYQSRIASAVGVTTPNPWNPLHAITATALYVSDLGAGAQTFTAEREAACRYYSGRGCSDPKVNNLFYGNAVMEHAKKIQANIDVLNSV